ncbi:hypothetical protein DFJ74DRAFT_376490 [Hyaloraphidium curvatum]|nr:hypothetical protein DFJ74DRAFT_376490 [Hyaloraphidium curvatum]
MPDGSTAPAFEPRTRFPPFEEVIGGRSIDLQAWLDNRRKYNERGGGLFRVHNKLYDLSNFEHPGGNVWLDMTRGQDITEHFEAHHLDIEKARAVLEKYYVRDADWPRESPLTVEPGGFFDVLRARVREAVKKQGPGPKLLSKLVVDTTALSFLALAGAAAYKRSIPLAVLAGLAAGMTQVAGHNFAHQKHNWRTYLIDLVGSSSWALRVHHCLSHHIYPNTSLDCELPLISMALAGMKWDLDQPKSTNSYLGDFIKWHYGIVSRAVVGTLLTPLIWLRQGGPRPENLLTWLVFLGMVGLRRRSGLPHSKSARGVLETFGLYLITKIMSGEWGLTFGLTVGHYTDFAWRQGEEKPGFDHIRDFGLFQVEVTGDRIEQYMPGSSLLLPAVLTTFGDHTLHHLLPAVDHAYHRWAYPELAKTCNEFGVRFEFLTFWEMVGGFFRQLRRREPYAQARRVGWDGQEIGWVDEKTGFKKDPRKKEP